MPLNFIVVTFSALLWLCSKKTTASCQLLVIFIKFYCLVHIEAVCQFVLHRRDYIWCIVLVGQFQHHDNFMLQFTLTLFSQGLSALPQNQYQLIQLLLFVCMNTSPCKLSTQSQAVKSDASYFIYIEAIPGSEPKVQLQSVLLQMFGIHTQCLLSFRPYELSPLTSDQGKV